MRNQIIIGVVVLALVTGGGWFLTNRTSQNHQERTSTQETSVTDAPEPTEEIVEMDKGDLSITILNGSGVAGLAGDLQSDLEDEDFKVESTKNADNFDYDTTLLQTKADVPDEFVQLLEDQLSDKYGNVETEVLDENEDPDVLIIIGGQQEEEEKSEETPTPSDEDKQTDTESEPTLTQEPPAE